MLVTPEDVGGRLKVEFTGVDLDQCNLLIEDAEEIVRDAFERSGRDFDAEIVAAGWLERAAKRVIRQMVAAAITVGPHAGQRSAQSTTGQESDSVTWTDSALLSVRFGGVFLTDEQREELGLPVGALARHRFGRPSRWPEVRLWRR